MTSLKPYRIEQSVDVNLTGIVFAHDEESALDIWSNDWQRHVIGIEDLSWDRPWDVSEDSGEWDAGDFIEPADIAKHTSFGWVAPNTVVVTVTPEQASKVRGLISTLLTLGADVVPGIDASSIQTLHDILRDAL